MSRFFMRSSAMGFAAVVFILFFFGMWNRNLVDFFNHTAAFEHGDGPRLLYESTTRFEAIPRTTIMGIRGFGNGSWSDFVYLFENNCVAAKLDNEVFAFFKGGYSVYDLDLLFKGDESSWKRANGYPENTGEIIPAWAGPAAGALVFVAQSVTMDNSAFLLKAFRVAPGSFETFANGGILPTGDGFYMPSRPDYYLRGAELDNSAVALFFRPAGGNSSGIRLTLLDESGFSKPENTGLDFRRFDVTSHDGAVLIAGLGYPGKKDGALIKMVRLDGDLGVEREWKIDPKITGLLGTRRFYDVAFVEDGGRLTLLVYCRSDIYQGPVEGGGEFKRIAGSSAVKGFLVKSWLAVMGLMSLGAILFSLLSIARVFSRRIPYAIPSVKVVPAPPFQRGVAYMADLALCIAVSLPLMYVFGLFDSSISERQRADYLEVGQVFFLAGFVLYSFVFELIFGWTPGKRALGLRTVGEEGSRAGVFRVLVRNMFKLIPELIVVEAMFLLLSVRRQRIGDYLAGTFVILDEPGSETSREDVE